MGSYDRHKGAAHFADGGQAPPLLMAAEIEPVVSFVCAVPCQKETHALQDEFWTIGLAYPSRSRAQCLGNRENTSSHHDRGLTVLGIAIFTRFHGWIFGLARRGNTFD